MNEYERLLARGGLSLERLATLCRVVEEGGISRAAGGDLSRLSLYSRQIKELETFFGVALGRKVGRVVVPTEAAHTIAAAARAHFKAIHSFIGIPSVTADFSLGASHSLLEWFVLPRIDVLADKLKARRRLRLISMRTRELVAGLEDHRLDVALLRSDAVPRGLKTREVLRLGYGLFVPKALVGNRSPRQVLEELPLAIALGGNLRTQVDVAAERQGIRLRHALEVSSFTLAADAVRVGGYAALLPEIAASALDGKKVLMLPIPFGVEPARTIVAAWRHTADEKPLLAAVRALSL